MASNTAAEAGKDSRRPSPKSAYTRSSSSSREIANARISRSVRLSNVRMVVTCSRGRVGEHENLPALLPGGCLPLLVNHRAVHGLLNVHLAQAVGLVDERVRCSVCEPGMLGGHVVLGRVITKRHVAGQSAHERK